MDEAFIFASGITAILQNNRVKIQPDFNAIHQYLNIRYFPADKTSFKNIKTHSPKEGGMIHAL